LIILKFSRYTTPKKYRTIGEFKGKIHMSPDFDKESDEILGFSPLVINEDLSLITQSK